MCFQFFGCCNRCNPCNNYCPYRGLPGPVGPQGPAGIVPPEQIASFVSATSGALATGANIPFTDEYNLAPLYITHTAGSPIITLQPGYYQISYNTGAVSTTTGILASTLYVNGVAYAGSLASVNGTANIVSQLSSSFILYVPTASTISLQNTGANTTTFSNTTLVARRINATLI